MATTTTTVAKHLGDARAKLGANDNDGALDALLDAWRRCRSPRIARLIDRVSDRVTAVRDPIKASSVTLRTELWLKVAKKKDSADLGRLLATPWPGTWKDALPVIEALVKFDADPRVAMALTQLVDEVKYDTWTSIRLYRPLFKILDNTLDIRTLPLLEAQEAHKKSRWYKRSTQPLEVAVIAKLKRTYAAAANGSGSGESAALKLDAQGETELVQVEALFASDATAEKALAKGAAEFIAAIYADPNDDALRSVFADWLTERNDPRGEFITLQLARHEGRSNDASLKREASLIKQYGKEWATPPIDRSLDKDGRVFERGFLAHGMLNPEERPKVPPADFSDPAWATFRSLEMGRSILYADEPEALELAIVNLPSMRFIRVFRGLKEVNLAAIIDQGEPRPQFDEVDFAFDDTRDEDASLRQARRDRIAKGYAKVFPNVKRLCVQDSELKEIPWLLKTPLVKNIQRFTLATHEYPIGKLARIIEAAQLPHITELCFGAAASGGYYSSYRAGSSWRFLTTRDESGRFTKIHGGPAGTSSVPNRHTLESVLKGLKPNELTELIVEHARVCTYDETDIKAIETCFEKFKKKTPRIEVPWERLSAKPAEKLSGIEYVLNIETPEKFSWKDSMPKLLALIGEAPLNVVVDSYEVNSGKHMSLPTSDVVAKKPNAVSDLVIDLIGRKRTRYLRLYRKIGSELSAVNFGRNGIHITFARPEGGATADRAFLEPFIAWLIRFLDAIPVWEAMTVFDDVQDVPWLEPFRNSPRFGWINVLSAAQHGKWLDFDGLEKIAKRVEWLEVHRSKRNAILVMGDRPTVMPNEKARLALQVELLGLMWKTFAKETGFVPHELVRKMLGPPLKKLGFTEVAQGELETAQGALYYAAHPKSGGTRGIVIDALNPLNEDTSFSLSLREAPRKKDADLTNYSQATRSFYLRRTKGASRYFEADTEKKARASLTDVITQLETTVMPWFETPPDTGKKKKRR